MQNISLWSRDQNSVLNGESHEIALSEDPNYPSILDNHQAADLTLKHNLRGFDQAPIRLDGRDVSFHGFAHDKQLQRVVTRTPAVPERAQQAAVEQIALSHDAQQRSLTIDDRQMPDSTQAH